MGKKPKVDCSECPAGLPGWLATFGDLMSLLLTFFILLLTFSSQQESKFKEGMMSLQGALGVLDSYPTVSIQKDLLLAIPTFNEAEYNESDNDEKFKEMESLAAALNQSIEQLNIKKDMKIITEGDKVRIRISNPLFFGLGKANFKPFAKNILNNIIIILKGKEYDIAVEGHTDDLPIKTKEFPSNWELSTKRAVNVVRYFIDKGKISPEYLTAAGYAEFRPIVYEKTAKARNENRRVEIFIKFRKNKSKSK